MSARRLGRRRAPGALVTGVLAALIALVSTMPVNAQNPSGAAAPTAPPSAGTSSESAPDLESLRSRAAQFWAARVAGDTKQQWELLEPRGRGRISVADYGQGRGAVKYLAYQVEDAKVDGYFATVKVRLLIQPNLPGMSRLTGPEVTVTEDAWVRVRGVWYRSIEQGQEQGPQGPGR